MVSEVPPPLKCRPGPPLLRHWNYANFNQTLFATARGYQWRFGWGWGCIHDAQ